MFEAVDFIQLAKCQFQVVKFQITLTPGEQDSSALRAGYGWPTQL